MRFFSEDGRLRNLAMPPTAAQFDRILPVHLPDAQLSLYIAWKYEHNVVQVEKSTSALLLSCNCSQML